MAFDNVRGAAYVAAAMTAITSNDAIVKHLTQVFSIGQIMFLRGLLITVIFALVMGARRQPVFDRRALHPWNLARAGCELLATLFFLSGLALLPIAIASTLGFSSPIFLALLAAVLLGERVGPVRWMAIFGGFAGVVLIGNPLSSTATWAVVLPLIAALFVALRDLAIRYVPAAIPSSQLAFTNAWMVMLGGGLLSLAQGWGSPEAHWYLWFFALAGALYCGYLFLIIGARLGELSFIGPFKYVSILIAIGYGYLIWGDRPTAAMLAGAAIVVASGIALVVTERRRQRR